MTLLHRWSLLVPYLHNYFPNNAWLNLLKFQTPNPPNCNGSQIWAQLTKWNLGSSLIPLHKKSLWSFSIQLATSTGMETIQRKKLGKLERMVLIKVIFPLFIGNLLWSCVFLFEFYFWFELEIYLMERKVFYLNFWNLKQLGLSPLYVISSMMEDFVSFKWYLFAWWH